MTDVFLEHRPLLFGIAYRMLGSVAEAEDAVQDTFLRWQKQAGEGAEIRSAKAWLIAAITRLCIDRLRSARRQREEYFGIWLPEPLVEPRAATEQSNAALADSLSTAFLLMLETLTPDERAVFLLREAFDYDYDEIADLVGKSEANCRQIVRRAKEHLAQRRERQHVAPEQAEKLVQQFLVAARDGDVPALLALLTEDATLATDGGGRVRAAPQPIRGPERIVRFLLGIRGNFPPDAEYRLAQVNGSLGVVMHSAGRPFAVLSFAFADGRLAAVFSVSNPDKLRHVAAAPAAAERG